MGLLGWVVFGGLAGWIASALMKERQGCFMNVIVGIIGAVVGGFLFSLIGGVGVTGFNIWSFIVAIIGAVVFIGVVKALRGDGGK